MELDVCRVVVDVVASVVNVQSSIFILQIPFELGLELFVLYKLFVDLQ